MKASDLYNNQRTLIETFGRSKTFETCRRMREVYPGFPKYLEEVSEYDAAQVIFIMAKTGKTTTKKAVYDAINSSQKLKSGDEFFFAWLGDALTKPQFIKDRVSSIWIFEDSDFVQVNLNDSIKVFQGTEKVKTVSRAVHLSAQFLYDFSLVLNKDLVDVRPETVFEDDTTDEEYEAMEEKLNEQLNKSK